MTALQVRPLHLQDVHDFRQIRLSALKNNPEMFASTYAIEAEKPFEIFAQVIIEMTVFGAYHENSIMGMLIFHQEKSVDHHLKTSHTAHLYGFFVEPRFRGQGIATQLLHTVLNYAQDKVKQIQLTVIATNLPAIQLYKKCGFQQCLANAHAIATTLHPVDEITLSYSYPLTTP